MSYSNMSKVLNISDAELTLLAKEIQTGKPVFFFEQGLTQGEFVGIEDPGLVGAVCKAYQVAFPIPVVHRDNNLGF